MGNDSTVIPVPTGIQYASDSFIFLDTGLRRCDGSLVSKLLKDDPRQPSLPLFACGGVV